MSEILVNAVVTIANKMKQSICNNVSFHASSEFIELASGRDQKYPALFLRGPEISEDLIYRSEVPDIIVDKEAGTFIKRAMPKICDVYFKLIVYSEGDIEGLRTISKIISFFSTNKQLTIKVSEPDEEPEKSKIFNMTLINPVEETGGPNVSNLTKYEGRFVIEGIEFSSSEETIGKIAAGVNLNVNQK